MEQFDTRSLEMTQLLLQYSARTGTAVDGRERTRPVHETLDHESHKIAGPFVVVESLMRREEGN